MVGPVGRPNTPSTLKDAKGNPGGRELNRGALTVPIEIPERPSRLIGEARKEWDRMAQVLKDNSLITKLDRTALIIYVDAFGMYSDAMALLKKRGNIEGMLQTTAKTDYETLSGLSLIIRDARSTMLGIMTQFGMTPSSRERVSIKNNQIEMFAAGRENMN